MARHDDRAAGGHDGLDERLRRDQLVEYGFERRRVPGGSGTRPVGVAQRHPRLGRRAASVVEPPERLPRAVEHGQPGARLHQRGRQLAAGFVHRQRRGKAPQAKRRRGGKERRRHAVVTQRIAVVGRLRLRESGDQQRRAVGRPRRRPGTARDQLRRCRRLGTRARWRGAFRLRQLHGGDPHGADAAAHGVKRQAGAVGRPREVTLGAGSPHGARGLRRLGRTVGRRAHRPRPERDLRGTGLGERHYPDIHVVVGTAVGHVRDQRAVGRDAGIGFAVRSLSERHRRLPGRGTGHFAGDEEVPLRAGIRPDTVAARRPAGEDEPAVRRPRGPALVARQGRDGSDPAVAHRGHEDVEAGAAVGGKRDARSVGRPGGFALDSRRGALDERGRLPAVRFEGPDGVERGHGDAPAIRRPRRVLGPDVGQAAGLGSEARVPRGHEQRRECHGQCRPARRAGRDHFARTASAIRRADRP